MFHKEKMSASVMTGIHKVEVQEVPIPKIEDNQVLVKIEAVGVCGSDTHFYEKGVIGDIVVEGPIILGHESAGEIVAVGSAVSSTRIGEKVSVEPQFPCRTCDYCKDGRYHLCRSMRFYAAYPIDGAFCEYAVIDSDFAHPTPSHMSAEQAALVEPVSVAVHANRKGNVKPGDRVLITGAGPIGILNAQVAKVFGACEIVVSDPVQNRREFVLNHGATKAVDPLNDSMSEYDQHFDVYIDASGNEKAILSSLDKIKPGGVAVLVGMGGDYLNIPIAMIQHREIMVTGTYRYVNTWKTAIDLVANGSVNVDALITGRFGLEQVAEALMNAKTDPKAIKSVVIPGLKNN